MISLSCVTCTTNLIHFIQQLFPSHEQLALCFSCVPLRKSQECCIHLDSDQSGNVVAGVEHLGGLLEQILQLQAVLSGGDDGGLEIIDKFSDRVCRLPNSAVTTSPIGLWIKRIRA